MKDKLSRQQTSEQTSPLNVAKQHALVEVTERIKMVAETSRQCQILMSGRGKLAPSRMVPEPNACHQTLAGQVLPHMISQAEGGYVMSRVSSGIKVAAAVLMLAGLSVTSRAYAQASQDVAACTEKCKADETKCLNDQGSEEMCDYDFKGCKKACGDTK